MKRNQVNLETENGKFLKGKMIPSTSPLHIIKYQNSFRAAAAAFDLYWAGPPSQAILSRIQVREEGHFFHGKPDTGTFPIGYQLSILLIIYVYIYTYIIKLWDFYF